MSKGEWVRGLAIAVAILLLVTGQWGVLLFGATWYHLARMTVHALERRSEREGGSQVPDAPLV